MSERQSEMKLKILRTDNRKEYVNHGFEGYLKQHGIRHQKTTDYTPEQNGMAERANRSIVERARCMLFEAGLPKFFWAEAASTAVYLLNRSPTLGHNITPEEAWTGRRPNLSHVRIFGTKTMAFIPKQKRKKWDPKSRECILTGFDEDTKGYRLYDPKVRTIIKSREVTFIDETHRGGNEPKQEVPRRRTVVQLDLEEVVPLSPKDAPTEPHPDELEEDEEFFTDCDTTGANEDDSSGSNVSTDSVIEVTNVLPPRQSSHPPQSQVSRRSGREHKLPGKYDNFKISCKGLPHIVPPQTATRDVNPDGDGPSTNSVNQDQFSGLADSSTYSTDRREHDDPVTHQEALAGTDSVRWKVAMKEEYDALINNETWTLTELPKGRSAIKCKWVYKTKHDASGSIDRYKARLVIKGYSQRKGVDYDETYSPVVRHSSLRYLFAMAAKYDLQVDQMDAITAFLQGDLEEEIFMEQPPCFVKPGKHQLVCRLNKALYGLKQSSRVWNMKLNAALKKMGLVQSEYDPCLYYWIQDEKLLFVAVYVDDVLIFSNDVVLKKNLKLKLSSTFRMKDLGPAASCLGIRVTRTDEAVSLDQEAYITSILCRFSMQDAKTVATPMNCAEKLSKEMSPKTAEEAERMKDVPYQEAVGCLMYLAQCTRPDILFAVNVLSRFNNCPGPKHWEAVKHLLRYLKGTSHIKLKYSTADNSKLVGYSDADWASDLDDRRSTSGYVFLLQGGAVSWCCKRQTTVSLSTCEAEYMALSAAVQEASWWQGLLSQFGQQNMIELRCDNQSSICIAQNGGYTPRTKHIDIRHHYIRDALDRKIIKLCYVKTEQQVADGLTKPLQRIKHERNRKAMGLK